MTNETKNALECVSTGDISDVVRNLTCFRKTALESINTDDISALLRNLTCFRYIASDESVFVEIFGAHIAEHLWRKWAAHGDVVQFVSYLDNENTRKLSDFLVQRTVNQMR